MTDITKIDREHMGKALALAEEALFRGEFPVGCVVVKDGTVIASGARTGSIGPDANELDHAEIVALRSLAASGSPPSLGDATIYCTMEPCLMCFGAIVLAGIRRIVYAYEDVMGGGASVDLQRLRPLYRDSETKIVAGVRRTEGLALFRRFFEDPRHVYWQGSLLAQYTLEQRPGTER
ncbi:MAG: nucleoside deaminase [Desulfobacterales bacterium]